LLTALASSYHTVVAARFLAGLPHGAFFGIAALVATSLAGPERRAWAVARVLLGLMIANVIGVPIATALGQHLGWRSAFVLVALIGVATILALRSWVAESAAPHGASLRTELRVLRRPQVWLTLGVGAIGFGGMFAVYSYITPTLTSLAGMRATTVPFVLAVWGLGMVAGNIVGGWLADRGVVRAMLITLATTAVFLALFTVTSRYAVAATATAFLLGTTVAMGPALQVRLMDVAADAQTITAALVHSAFNAANALGPWLGGLALASGFGWTAPAWVGVALAIGGIVMLGGSVLVERFEVTTKASPATALPASFEPLKECA
ncbi:MAG: MFS transporter, partial [Gemmatimonadaceae bacterium]